MQIILIAIFQIKHYLADFVFQTNWMVMGKGQRRRWILPLFTHSLIHGGITAAIIIIFTGRISLGLSVGSLETIAHFCIDRVKASPNMFGQFKDMTKPLFWNLLGADQLAHQFCYLLIVYCIS